MAKRKTSTRSHDQRRSKRLEKNRSAQDSSESTALAPVGSTREKRATRSKRAVEEQAGGDDGENSSDTLVERARSEHGAEGLTGGAEEEESNDTVELGAEELNGGAEEEEWNDTIEKRATRRNDNSDERTEGEDEEDSSEDDLEYTYVDEVEEAREARFSNLMDTEKDQLSQDYSYESEEEVEEIEGSGASARRKYTLIGIFSTLQDALVARDVLNKFDYTYDTRYTSASTSGHIYKCISHAVCGHRLKVKTLRIQDGDDRFQLWEAGHHTTVPGKSTRRGIHLAVKEEVESMISVGHGAQYILNHLEQRYFFDTEMMKLLPERRQIENRKAYLKKNMTGGWEIVNNATFLAALQPCFVTIDQIRELLSRNYADDDPELDRMITIHVSYLGANKDSPESFVALVTSLRLLINMDRAMRDQGMQLLCATDGTYKLHYGGWTVVDCGSETVVWSRNEYVHRFVPWAFMFVRTERKEAYVEMFKALSLWARELFSKELQVAYASLDHSEAIASAFEDVWPRVVLLTCWPHLVRNARSKRGLLQDGARYDTLIKPHLKLLRSARSHAQFIRMSVIITDEWIACGERAFADWFRSVYLTRRWEKWHITAAGIGGVIPSQQGIEAYHGAIKKTCAPNRLASTSGVLSSILPKIITSAGKSLCPNTVFHYGEGPVPPEMIMKASLLTENKGNHKLQYQGRGNNRQIAAVLYNSSRHMLGNGSPNPAPISVARATRFMNSLNGIVADGILARELQFEVCSLHRVTISRMKIEDPLQLSPVWSSELVGRIRQYLKCTCHSYARTGWACSHTLATLSLLDLLDLQSALSSVPVRKTPGRPPNRGLALQHQDAHERYYARGRLLKKFLARPGLPLKWRVVDDFEVNQNGEIETANFVGEVVSVRQTDGEFIWTARFDDNDLRDYSVEELATAVARAHQLGVEIAL